MIEIFDNDKPISVADKIITAKTEVSESLGKGISKALGGNGTREMYNLEEIKEIADYLMCYFNHNKGRDN